ncbi:MAG: tetratricopeptide repeat protein [Parasulfuritortus sp.]|nr:tetratricopeptide repeat protein [Parasulfuritortus sp.]
MAFNRFALALLVSLLPGLALSASTPLQDASQLFHQGRSAQALEKVNSYLAGNAKDPQARFLKGLILAEMNRAPEAIKTFTELTDDYPELPEPYNNLAVLYASQGQYEQAKNSLEKAIRTNPTYATAHENLGDIYAKMASQAYDKALQLDKSNTSAQMKLSLVKDIFTPTALEKARSAKHAPAKVAALAQDTTPEPVLSTPITKPNENSKQVSTGKPDNNSSQPDDAVQKTIQDWAAAWSSRNVVTYLSFYAANFAPPEGMNRTDWEALRKKRLTAPEYIRVQVSDFRIQRNGNQATATFKEHYESNALKVNTSKSLTFELQNGAWKIVAEK